MSSFEANSAKRADQSPTFETRTYPQERVEILAEDGSKMAGNIMRPEGLQPDQKVPLVILVHGAAGEFEKDSQGTLDKSHSNYPVIEKFQHIQAFLAKNGIMSIVYASRGIDGSEGSYNNQTLLSRSSDIKHTEQQMATAQNVDTDNIFLAAFSMGAHAVTRALDDSPLPIKGTLLLEPAAYSEQAEQVMIGTSDFTQALRDDSKNLLFSPAFYSLGRYRRNGGNVFIAYGTDDVDLRSAEQAQADRTKDLISAPKKPAPVLPFSVTLGYRQMATSGANLLELEGVGHELIGILVKPSQEKKTESDRLKEQMVRFIKNK